MIQKFNIKILAEKHQRIEGSIRSRLGRLV